MTRVKNINIFGSTGQIGSKSLKILNKYFPYIKINLLVANNNYRKLIKQTNNYNPRFICINNISKIPLIKKNVNTKKTRIISPKEVFNFLNTTKSDLTLLAISGYRSLNYLSSIFNNTKHLGIVSKECIIAAGHLFNRISKNKKTIITPIDSEHYSLQNIINLNNYYKIKKIYLTASGGPFFKKKYEEFKNVSFAQAIKHPKWKMGYKNSIDSATLANKCLELIEAHYLFDIPFKKLDIILHPEALVHSAIEYTNYTSVMNYFYNDMFIPLYNYFSTSIDVLNFPVINSKYNFESISKLNFYKPNFSNYPILKIFNKIDKSLPKNLIKFNCANEFAVNLFAKKKIKFGNIHKIIEKSISLDLNGNINDVNSVIEYQKYYIELLKSKFD